MRVPAVLAGCADSRLNGRRNDEAREDVRVGGGLPSRGVEQQAQRQGDGSDSGRTWRVRALMGDPCFAKAARLSIHGSDDSEPSLFESTPIPAGRFLACEATVSVGSDRLIRLRGFGSCKREATRLCALSLAPVDSGGEVLGGLQCAKRGRWGRSSECPTVVCGG